MVLKVVLRLRVWELLSFLLVEVYRTNLLDQRVEVDCVMV